MISITFLRGFKQAIGSWKIICILVCNSLAVALSNFPPISLPLKTIDPEVGLYKRIILLPVVDLPEPDSPTKP